MFLPGPYFKQVCWVPVWGRLLSHLSPYPGPGGELEYLGHAPLVVEEPIGFPLGLGPHQNSARLHASHF